MGIVNFSIKNPLVVNLFLVLIVVLGVMSWRSMPEEMFPVGEIDKFRLNNLCDTSTQTLDNQLWIYLQILML